MLGTTLRSCFKTDHRRCKSFNAAKNDTRSFSLVKARRYLNINQVFQFVEHLINL